MKLEKTLFCELLCFEVDGSSSVKHAIIVLLIVSLALHFLIDSTTEILTSKIVALVASFNGHFS